MAEGFDPSDAPVRRGRRDPNLAHMLEAEDQLQDAGDPADMSIVGLLPGDMIMAKVTLAAPTSVGDGWFTYGTQTHVMDDETETEAFQRLADVVNTRVLDLSQDAIERVNELVEEQREQARHRRIVPATRTAE